MEIGSPVWRGCLGCRRGIAVPQYLLVLRIGSVVIWDCRENSSKPLTMSRHRSERGLTGKPASLSACTEKKAAGAPLIYELRQTGIPLSEYTPSKGQDKIARVNAVSDLFASGMVWRPEKKWADELVEEVASFPNGRAPLSLLSPFAS